jgi:nitroreductase
VTEASHLIVIARRTDVRENITTELLERTAKAQGVSVDALEGLKKMVGGSIAGRSDLELDAWAKNQAYIALGIMIETASLLGIDNGPMEGFDPAKVDEILGLKEKNLTSTTLLALGYRSEGTNLRPKVRRAFEEVVEFIK